MSDSTPIAFASAWLPPTSPEQLEAALYAAGASFDEPGELQIALGMYTQTFVEAFDSFQRACPGRTNLFLNEAGWGEAEAPLLAGALRYAATHCELPRELIVHVLEGNDFSAEEQAALHDAVSGSSLRLK